MPSKPSSMDRVNLTRSKLEERFAAFEKALLEETSSHIRFVRNLHDPYAMLQQEGGGVAPSAVEDYKAEQYKEVSDQMRLRLVELEDMVRRQREQLTKSIEENKRLVDQGKSLEERLRQALSTVNDNTQDSTRKRDVELKEKQELTERVHELSARILQLESKIAQDDKAAKEMAARLKKAESEAAQAKPQELLAAQSRANELQSEVERLKRLLTELEQKTAQQMVAAENAPVQIVGDKELVAQIEQMKEQYKKAKDTISEYAQELEERKAQVREQQELLVQIRSRREQIMRSQENTAKELLRTQGESVDIRKKLALLETRRKGTLRFMRMFSSAHRNQRHLLHNSIKLNEDYQKQVEKLSLDLDSAMENIAELRDQLNYVGHGGSGATKNPTAPPEA